MSAMETAPRTIVVTGATGGVGRGIALACGEAGWQVWIAARREHEGEAVAREVDAAGGRGHFVACDVGTRESVDAALDTIAATSGRLDGIVHNATSALSPVPTHLRDVTLEELRDHVGVALRGAYLLARKGHALLRESRGCFLLLTSEAGSEGKSRLAPYAGVKAAQRGFARTLAREWGPDGIRVNALAPLAMSPAFARAFELESAMEDRVLGRIPLGRLGDAATDVGRAARFLLSEDAAYVSAHTLMADGGSCPAT
ncbi:MAG: SDR family oxidoreductase [Deltaproteobacteria bacterium]|jgi:3-oxoacyl-[acyl-carrier protein] reductase|nr:SDR family oxidoreductase [Deltaproteobacteria bacterium]